MHVISKKDYTNNAKLTIIQHTDTNLKHFNVNEEELEPLAVKPRTQILDFIRLLSHFTNKYV